LKLPWPELPSAHRPEENIREILDYLCWVATEMAIEVVPSGADLAFWRGQVQEAYGALFLPPVPNHGDPYPPDVPPPRTPGVWPDVPSAGVPGMTLRHQLKVISVRALELRKLVWIHARDTEVAEWDRRLSLARAALDRGDEQPMPEEARTQPSETVLAEARAQEEAIKEHARKRAIRLQRLKAQSRKKPVAPKKVPVAEAKETPVAKKKAAPKAKKKVPATKAKKKPVAKKVAKKKAAPKAKKKAPTAKAKKKPVAKKKVPAAKAKKKPVAKKKVAPKAKTKPAAKKKVKKKASPRKTRGSK